MTSATVCDEASHGRSVEEHFEHRYQESRAVFEKDRASQAAVELRRNRQSLEAALEPLRLLQCAKVASKTTDDKTAALAHERSRRKRRQEEPSERLEAGKSIGIKLDVRSSDVPQHYRSRILPAGQTTWSELAGASYRPISSSEKCTTENAYSIPTMIRARHCRRSRTRCSRRAIADGILEMSSGGNSAWPTARGGKGDSDVSAAALGDSASKGCRSKRDSVERMLRKRHRRRCKDTNKDAEEGSLQW